MLRQITFGFAVMLVSVLSSTSSAFAQFGGIRIKPPKIQPPRGSISQPGPYQRGMIERSFNYGATGASVGGSAGTYVGGPVGGAVGTVAGTAVGAGAGAIAHDHHHNKEKVHNFRTHQDVTIINEWWRPVNFEIMTSQGWTPFQLPSHGARGFRGPVQIRFENALGQWRNVTMQGRNYVFRSSGSALELFW